MPTQRDFLEYHKSIGRELSATKNRIRHLIGNAHWGEDGRHKEAILRRVLRNHISETLHIGTGFVCCPHDTSHQTDILVIHRDKPSLFRDDEVFIVTPDAVAAVIEVKTRVPDDLPAALEKLADDIATIRRNGNEQCRAGFFIYERNLRFEHGARWTPPEQLYEEGRYWELAHQEERHEEWRLHDPEYDEWRHRQRRHHEYLLSSIRQASHGRSERVINWIAAGPDTFVRYWHRADPIRRQVRDEVWHSYELRQLAHAYFIGNTIWETSPRIDEDMGFAWFPVEGGKERRRRMYAALGDGDVEEFPETHDEWGRHI